MGFFKDLDGRVVGAPSILAADFANLAEEVRRARDGGAELVHFDVMDNHFVPNLTVGPAVAASLVRATDLPIDAHLQVERPDSLIPAFVEAGVVSICVQPEVTVHLHRTLAAIRAAGLEAGCALNPTTPPETLEWALPYLDYVNVMSVNPGFGGRSSSLRWPRRCVGCGRSPTSRYRWTGESTQGQPPSWSRLGRGS
jgi:ribulose-phosphate 3-epimerase